MSTFTTYLDNALIAHALGKTSFTMPTVAVGLSSTLPTIAGTNITEPTIGTNGYARVATSGLWGAASSGTILNSGAINFPTSTGAWSAGASQTYLCFYDATSGGNLLAFELITTAFAVGAAGITPSAAIGQVSTTIG